MVDQESVQTLFQKMKKAGWDMHKEHVWGYFFKDPSEEKLSKFSLVLNKLGYKINDINQSYPDKIYWLHIEKIQKHSIKSLNKLNQSFYLLAKENAIAAYDGMDISPVDFDL